MPRKSRIFIACAALAFLSGAALLLSRRASSGATLGQSVNAGIDNLLATGMRLLELPLFMLLAAAAILSVLLALPILRWGTQSGRLTPSRMAAAALAGIALLGLALAADHKIGRLQAEVSDLRGKLSQERMARVQALNDSPAALAPAPQVGSDSSRPAGPASATQAAAPGAARPAAAPAAASAPAKPPATAKAGKRDAFLIDVAQVPRDLAVLFGPVVFHPVIHDEAADIVEVDIQNPAIIAYMAIINLRTPGLEIKFGGSLTAKTLTSDFARANDCQIAINGEAGASPLANSGLGVWRGNMISAGQVLMKEDPANKRPFLSFDQQNHASFTALAAADRAIAADKFNVIWGRLDALIDGHVQTENERDRQPRTAMGINKDGTRLFLLVVDGRQQQYSAGFTREEVGLFLQNFGATDGMLCDEGGSSCLYAQKFGGIVNRPSDGVERPTYTHFGIALKAN